MDETMKQIITTALSIINDEFLKMKKPLDLECDYASIEELINRGNEYLKYSKISILEKEEYERFINAIDGCYNLKKGIEVLKNGLRNTRTTFTKQDLDKLSDYVRQLEEIIEHFNSIDIMHDYMDLFLTSSSYDLMFLEIVVKNKREDLKAKGSK